MIIGIDASRAIKAERTGTEEYSYQIIKHVISLASTDIIQLYSPQKIDQPEFNRSNCQWKIVKEGRLWSQLKLVSALKKYKPEVLFVPSHVIPYLSSTPAVVTIHDLAYKHFPWLYSTTSRQYLHFTTAVSAKKAKQIIVPSESTANDLIKYYNTPAAKISVIPHGYDAERFNQNRQLEPIITEPYFYYLGRIENKKNIRLLLEAFNLLAKENREVKLVLAGKDGYGAEEIKRYAKQLPEHILHRITFTGYISSKQSDQYLYHAQGFVFPSQFEGFGLPILEAFAAGIPVVTSNSGALNEITNHAAAVLTPEKPLAWASAMSKILHQQPEIEQLRRSALNRAKEYSWERAAKQTLNVIKRHV